MYIESGILKGKKLLGQKAGLRPTTSKVKTALFNILQKEIKESRFLDCFAGTGAVGFQAYSMGAKEIGFVELNRDAIHFIKKNAQNFNIEPSIYIKSINVIDFLNQSKEDWDILFFSPPYDTIHWYQLLRVIEHTSLLKKSGIVVIQHPNKIKFHTDILDYYDKRQYGFNTLSFFRKKDNKI